MAAACMGRCRRPPHQAAHAKGSVRSLNILLRQVLPFSEGSGNLVRERQRQVALDDGGGRQQVNRRQAHDRQQRLDEDKALESRRESWRN